MAVRRKQKKPIIQRSPRELLMAIREYQEIPSRPLEYANPQLANLILSGTQKRVKNRSLSFN